MRLQDYNFKAKEKMQLALIQHCPLFVHSVPTHTINFLNIMNVPRWRESAVFKELIDKMGEREAKRRKYI